jgi:ribosomal protein L11 methyltransferase
LHWIAAKVVFDSRDPALTAELIADLFDTVGISGVVVDDPHLEPAEGWGSNAVPLPAQTAVTGYLPGDARCDRLRRALETGLAALAARHPLRYAIEYRQVEEEQWAESWKAFFHPQPITPRLVVKPTWCDHVPQPGQQVIEIDPGMAFGTGTHPTTALCVQLLEKHIRPGHRLLDVGTGSGILLIAGAKLGADHLTGVDTDPIAVSVARENLHLNAVRPDRFEVLCGHLIEPVSGTYDVVVANILTDVIVELLDHVVSALNPAGLFICSGILEARRHTVACKMAACGFHVADELARDEWVALAGRLTT